MIAALTAIAVAAKRCLVRIEDGSLLLGRRRSRLRGPTTSIVRPSDSGIAWSGAFRRTPDQPGRAWMMGWPGVDHVRGGDRHSRARLGDTEGMQRTPPAGLDPDEEGPIMSVPEFAAALDRALDQAARGGNVRSRVQKDAGISPSTFYAALSGQTLPRAETLDAILDA